MVSLGPYSGPVPPPYGAASGDDGFERLTPEAYLEFRLDDQLNYYRVKVLGKSLLLRRLQMLVYLVGGMGTFLAALGLELWIALTTACVTAVTSYLGSQQVESIVVKYSQAAVELGNVKAWWMALGPEAQSRQSAVDELVERTETVLMREHSQWVVQLEQAANRQGDSTPEDSEHPIGSEIG